MSLVLYLGAHRTSVRFDTAVPPLVQGEIPCSDKGFRARCTLVFLCVSVPSFVYHELVLPCESLLTVCTEVRSQTCVLMNKDYVLVQEWPNGSLRK